MIKRFMQREFLWINVVNIINKYKDVIKLNSSLNTHQKMYLKFFVIGKKFLKFDLDVIQTLWCQHLYIVQCVQCVQYVQCVHLENKVYLIHTENSLIVVDVHDLLVQGHYHTLFSFGNKNK